MSITAEAQGLDPNYDSESSYTPAVILDCGERRLIIEFRGTTHHTPHVKRVTRQGVEHREPEPDTSNLDITDDIAWLAGGDK